MEDKIKTSKFLSLILRHKPEAAGISLDENGWAKFDEILKVLKISKKQLNEIVESDDKKRFALNVKRTLIRASQGHSIRVNVGLEEKKPPKILYHGTSKNKEEILMKEGIKRMKRLHVHLSDTREKAYKVGQRHGNPIVFKVLARKMHEDGFQFFLSENEVWLTDYIPIDYISIRT